MAPATWMTTITIRRETPLRQKVERCAAGLRAVLAGWEGVEAIVLGETAEVEVLDPYFAIQLEVYHRGDLPAAEERRKRLGDPAAFEAASFQSEDHFLVEDLPVRARYRELAWFDRILMRIEDRLWAPHESGAWVFYQVTRGQVLYQRGGWLDTLRERLQHLPDSFWETLVESSRFSVERYLRDLSAAVFRGDPLFYLMSSAGFTRSLCSFLFALNRRFEPSGRMLFEQTLQLAELPEGFRGRFESFLRHEQGLPPERKREIAELLTRSILVLR